MENPSTGGEQPAHPEPASGSGGDDVEPGPAGSAGPGSAGDADPKPAGDADPEPAGDVEPATAGEAEPEPFGNAEPDPGADASGPAPHRPAGHSAAEPSGVVPGPLGTPASWFEGHRAPPNEDWSFTGLLGTGGRSGGNIADDVNDGAPPGLQDRRAPDDPDAVFANGP
ncbi:hypothetical protein ACQ7DA_14155 [Zafaria sp. J156]|uniref:hypothetical protein n=1 Tax=Zafaria sp. J156 TaxID=3116490 RepID=UPI002E7A0682|nr:hypothetical protein [Zafaria sp. J156]MEE1622364.1 hypothetical protein [Zafaria sp. J156]